MKKGNSRTSGLGLLMACFLLWMILGGIFLPPPSSVQASAEGMEGYDASYGFSITEYSVEMDIRSDRTIDVTENIGVYFLGYSSHGIIRDFPLGGGVRYRDFRPACDSSDFSPYMVREDDFLCFYLRGEQRTTKESRKYKLEYTMSVPKLEDEGSLPLNVIGYGWQSYQGISSFSAKINLPVAPQEVGLYSGKYGTTQNDYVQMTQEGNTIYLTAERLPTADIDAYGNATAAGVTLDLSFDPSALTVEPDWVLVAAVVVSLVAIGSMFLCIFLMKRTPVIPTVNLTAPEEMDPMRMGKIIDNHLDAEDIGAMVFWYADQGYLDIDFSADESNPILRRTDKDPPPEGYQRFMWQGLFERGSEVLVSSLENRFYKTADVLKLAVPSVASGMYRMKSILMASVCFGIWLVVLNALFALAWIQTLPFFIQENDFIVWGTAITSLIAFGVCYLSSLFAREKKFRWRPVAQWSLRLSVLAICCLFGIITCPEHSIAFSRRVSSIVVCASAIIGCLMPFCFDYTDEYAEKVGHIIGFKNFILYTERDRIRFMLQENPELYYHILPYAQVLGVTNEWTDKFKGLLMAQPSYVYYGRPNMVFNCMVWSQSFRALNVNMSTRMVSRPSPQGNSSTFRGFGGGGSHFGGGHGGGYGGGGFGGGGGRGC